MRNPIALLALFALLCSCAWPGLLAHGGPAGQKKGESDAREHIIEHIGRKEYKKALKSIVADVEKGVPELYYGAEYVDALNGLLRKGTGHYYSGEYKAAGLSFRLALESYPSASGIRGRVDFSPEEIETLIDGCSTNLMEEGLLSYREGALQNAIEAWEKIPAFDPANKEAKKALQTAITQLRNLKDLDKQWKAPIRR